jgi:hypothetical protein
LILIKQFRAADYTQAKSPESISIELTYAEMEITYKGKKKILKWEKLLEVPE